MRLLKLVWRDGARGGERRGNEGLGVLGLQEAVTADRRRERESKKPREPGGGGEYGRKSLKGFDEAEGGKLEVFCGETKRFKSN